jgi:hypothetical protein
MVNVITIVVRRCGTTSSKSSRTFGSRVIFERYGRVRDESD